MVGVNDHHHHAVDTWRKQINTHLTLKEVLKAVSKKVSGHLSRTWYVNILSTTYITI